MLVMVPPIAVDMMWAAAAGDRAAFASVHTFLCLAAVLSAYMERRLKYNTGIQRVQQGNFQVSCFRKEISVSFSSVVTSPAPHWFSYNLLPFEQILQFLIIVATHARTQARTHARMHARTRIHNTCIFLHSNSSFFNFMF